MKTVNLHEAKTQLSSLVEAAAHGEEIIIARYGKPLAKLVGLPLAERPLGFYPIEFQNDLSQPTDEDVLADFEGC